MIRHGALSAIYSLSSWPGMSGPPVAARACGGGPDTPGHDDEGFGIALQVTGASLFRKPGGIAFPNDAGMLDDIDTVGMWQGERYVLLTQ